MTTDDYTIDDLAYFMICFNCTRCSPFLVYVGSNDRIEKYRPLNSGIHLYCTDCSPDPDHYAKIFPGEEKLFEENSILNDKELLRTLSSFKYYSPFHAQLSPQDRIIITEQTKLLRSYSEVVNKPSPSIKKLEKLMKLFPTVNRMRNIKFASGLDMCEAVKRRYSEICQSYMALSEPQNYNPCDMTITAVREQAPRIERQDQIIQHTPPVLSSIVEESSHSAEKPSSSDISISTDCSDGTNAFHLVNADVHRAQDSSSQESNGLVQISALSSDSSHEEGALGMYIKHESEFLDAASAQNSSTQPEFSSRSVVTVPGENVSSQSVLISQPMLAIDDNVEMSDAGSSNLDYQQPSTSGTSDVPFKKPRFILPTNPDPMTYRKTNPSCRFPRLKGG
ncbi:uncharacterized protein LOC131690056 [Topomyia yanbarensis]|uniref:uncharacterized protein LOC131690056 n=1 Tax=Topomyia yanbarensis TaxID=2498891 RepID=UPI00273B9A80|nr:uncharacterized protein LOC131690056 [Topomyia yanbarensis]